MSAATLLWFITLLGLTLAESPVVETRYGPVKGFIYKTETGQKANVYLGIPFAKPPVGDLRFEKPEKPEKWTQTLEAIKFGPACVPHHRSGMWGEGPFDEDCLYVNIMTPAEKKKERHAVIVWIHGGGYNVASALLFGYKNVTDNFIPRDIVYVSLQYRLGPFGFISNGDTVLPGNLGLWDQTAALEFIKENIEFFGGDPDRITINGLSAGGGSTSALTLSPYSRGLFAGSIQMSGSTFAEWCSSSLVVESSQVLAKELQCDASDSTEMKKCLKTKSVDEFLDAVDKTGKTRDNSLKFVKFGPRLDGEFFPKSFEELLKEEPKVPTIIGMTAKDGLMLSVTPILESISTLHIEPEDFESYGEEELVTFIRTAMAPESEFGEQAEEAQQKLIDHYVNREGPAEKDYKYWLERYTELCSDVVFFIPGLKEAELKLRNGWPIWLYLTDYMNPTYLPEDYPIRGVLHAYEQLYMFYDFFFHFTALDEEDKRVQKGLLDAFAHFAEKGDPSTAEVKWNKITKDAPMQNLRFRPKPAMEKTMLENNFKFWKTMDSFDFDITSGRRRGEAEETTKDEL